MRLISTVIFCVLILACKKEDKPTNFIEDNNIDGKWQSETVPDSVIIPQAPRITRKLDLLCAQFVFEINYHNQDIDTSSACNKANYTEYIRGDYFVDGDTLRLIGNYKNAEGNEPVTETCSANGYVEKHYFIRTIRDRMNLVGDTEAFVLLLTEKIDC